MVLYILLGPSILIVYKFGMVNFILEEGIVKLMIASIQAKIILNQDVTTTYLLVIYSDRHYLPQLKIGMGS